MGVRLQVHEDIDCSEANMREALRATTESIRKLDEALLSDNLSSSFADGYIDRLKARRTTLSQIQDQLTRLMVDR